MGTNSQMMGWMVDTYTKLYGSKDINASAVVTGKPLSLGGIDGRTEATGLGVYFGIKELLNNDKFCTKYNMTKGVEGKRVVIQGLGNVGYWAAKFIYEAKAKVIGVVEYNSGIFNPDGLDIPAVATHFRAKGTLLGFPGAKEEYDVKTKEEVMYKECDILVPAAMEKVITKQNVERIQARMIAEGANGPTTYLAQKVFDTKHIPVVPDFVLNIGGVTVSYFEWVKGLQHAHLGRLTKGWEEAAQTEMLKLLGKEGSFAPKGATEKDIVYSALEEIMSTSIRDVFELSEKMNVSLRISAFIIGLNRVLRCYDDAGFVS
jgi:glutamate dehydrogenase (NAD(P)+)